MKCELICGDCCAEMAKLPNESFALSVTSPPYNLGIKYRTYRDSKSSEAYLAWAEQWAAEIRRVLTPDGSFFLNFAGSHREPWLPFELIVRLRKHFELQNTFHWVKAITVGDASSGHFKPVNSKRYVTNCHEYLFHLTKTGKVPLDRLAIGVPYMDKTNVKRWKHTGGSDRRCRGNTWFIPYPTVQSFGDRPHPAIFPAKLAEYCIAITHAKSVIDPFVGIGNSVEAAKSMGVEHFLGIDIDQSYLDDAAKKAL